MILSLLMLGSNIFAQTPSAKINKTWIKNGVERNGVKGLEIHADFNVYNMKGKEIELFSFFYDVNKQFLNNPNAANDYLFKGDSGNHLCAKKSAKATYVDSHWNDMCVFIPYNQFPSRSGKKDYYYCVYINGIGNGWLAGDSGYKDFYISWNNQSNNTRTSQNQRRVVKTENETYGYNGQVKRTRYSDGMVIEEHRSPCRKGWRCEVCNESGQEIIYETYGSFVTPCRTCLGNGFIKCSLCNGTGYTTNRIKYLDINEYYSNGKIALHLSSREFGGNTLYQGDLILYDSKQLEDGGTYWKLGSLIVSKDKQTLTYQNVTYRRCSSQEYQRLSGSLSQRSNQNYTPTVPSTVNNGNIDNIPMRTRQPRDCSRCRGTGRVPFPVDKYGRPHKNSTFCYNTENHTCSLVDCQECKKNHCVDIRHVHCDWCSNGKIY